MKILIALDRTEYAEIVLEHGLDQAARNKDAEIHIGTVLEEAAPAEAREWIDALVRDALEAFGLSDRDYEVHFSRGRPVPQIATLAAQVPADLLVIGRFQVPSAADTLIDIVECPTLVVGIDGTVLEPQCPACQEVRRDSDGERLFCEAHAGDRFADLAGRLPSSNMIGSRIW